MIGLAFQAMQIADAMRVSERNNHVDCVRRLETFGRVQRATGLDRREAGHALESEFATERNT